MSQSVPIPEGPVSEGSDPVFRRVLTEDAGVMLVPADITAVTLYVYDITDTDTPTTAIHTSATVAPNATLNGWPLNIYSTPQIDGWDLGGQGYNFKHRARASDITMQGGRRYRYEYKLDLADTGVGWALFIVRCVSVLST